MQEKVGRGSKGGAGNGERGERNRSENRPPESSETEGDGAEKNIAKAIELSQNGKRAVSKYPIARSAKQRTTKRVEGGDIAMEAAPPGPTKTT
jgi:hypothetical protein